MQNNNQTFGGLIKQVIKSPWKFRSAGPVVESVAALCINVWFLVLAVLGQFWVILSAILLLIQAYIVWLVWTRRMNRFRAVLLGAIIVLLNYSALILAVLGQFWVIGSTILATWQFKCLIQVCFGEIRKYRPILDKVEPTKLDLLMQCPKCERNYDRTWQACLYDQEKLIENKTS